VTHCTDTSSSGRPIRRANTNKAGAAEFDAVPPGDYVVCLCKSRCDLEYSTCVFKCEGPSKTVEVRDRPVPAVDLVLADCKCPKKNK
jgi:hypothetical protein